MKRDPITYRDLLEFLMDTIHPDNLDCHVTVCIDGEFKQCELRTSLDDDILDNGHPYLEVLE